jgi:HEAT repeat protein
VLWSARKIAEKRPDLTRSALPQVIALLEDQDPTARGHAAWALGAMQAKEAAEELKRLRDDDSPLYIYDGGELWEKTVGNLAQKSLMELGYATTR